MAERYVVCAANRYGDIIVCGPRHHDMTMNAIIREFHSFGLIERTQCRPEDQGFVDQWGVFMDDRKP